MIQQGALNGLYNLIEYKGYYIEYNFFGEHEYTVQYLGDDLVFTSEDEARAFIDAIVS